MYLGAHKTNWQKTIVHHVWCADGMFTTGKVLKTFGAQLAPNLVHLRNFPHAAHTHRTRARTTVTCAPAWRRAGARGRTREAAVTTQAQRALERAWQRGLAVPVDFPRARPNPAECGRDPLFLFGWARTLPNAVRILFFFLAGLEPC